MKTSFPNITEKKWYIIDANNQIVGRLATKIAKILRGKDKVEFSPHQDNGDHVVVINTSKIKLSGNKFEDKKYYSHSGYIGHLKETPAGKMLQENPTKILVEAVKGMLPKNKLRKHFLGKLRCFVDENHTHEAQTPIEVQL